MKAQSKDYIALQTIYRAKARSDLAEVTESVRTLESKLGRTATSNTIDSKEIEAFSKNAAFVKLVHGRKVICDLGAGSFGERAGWAARELNNDADNNNNEESQSLLPILIALLALDKAYDGVAPPATSARDLLTKAETETFKTHMANFVSSVLGNLKAAEPEFDVGGVRERVDRVVQEVQRSGPVELHNVSAMTGGIVAQEVIKIITKQYVPVDNTCVIDGIRSRTAVYRL